MTTSIDAQSTLDTEHDEHAHDHPSDLKYIGIAAFLAAITAIEVVLSYIDVGWLFLPALLALMAFKFIMVVRFFMHLKFDNRIFSWLFFTGLVLALAVYVATLASFRFFAG
jgi:cytochrome c oxidase subunit 4